MDTTIYFVYNYYDPWNHEGVLQQYWLAVIEMYPLFALGNRDLMHRNGQNIAQKLSINLRCVFLARTRNSMKSFLSSWDIKSLVLIRRPIVSREKVSPSPIVVLRELKNAALLRHCVWNYNPAKTIKHFFADHNIMKAMVRALMYVRALL